jgi:sugar phosphate isomerase/epimerase
MNRSILAVCLLLVAATARAEDRPAKGLPNPFFAMDTGFRRPGLTTEQQLDLLKELGYAGIAWTEAAPDEVKKVADQSAKRGLKMHAIYCVANVNEKGEVKPSANLPKLMEALTDHATVIWLYLPGKGPKVSELTDKSPAVVALRAVADAAAKHKLQVAVYPHAGFWIAGTADAIALAKAVGRKNFGVSFNLVHSLWAGEEKDIPDLLAKAGEKLFVVTVNGADKGVKRTPILTLDKGSYDIGIVLRKLKEMKYAGPIGFQGYGIKGDTRSIVGPTMKAWRKLSVEAAK